MRRIEVMDFADRRQTRDLRRPSYADAMASASEGASALCFLGNPPVQSGLTAAQVQAQNARQAIQVNQDIRAAILGNSIEVKQLIASATINNPSPTANSNTVQIPFRNVGLVKGFIVECDVTFAIATAATPTATNFNIANLISNFVLTDLDNYQRINTTGWHMNMIGSGKEGFPHGAALLLSAFDTPIKYGNNYAVMNLTAPTNAATGSAKMYYWVPLAYTGQDLRGAIFAGVVNATAYLQFTINSAPWIVNTSDATLAVLTGAANTLTSISSFTYNVYQVYLDQLPKYQSGAAAGSPILPPLDIATQYRLNNTSLFGVSAGQDFPVPFSNFQQFLSLSLIYDQNGTLNAGTDINYFALAAANTYLPFKVDPFTQAWIGRHKIKTDWPTGSYQFDFRGQPISTNQSGNMQLLLNAITAAAQTQVQAGFESFALVNTVLGAASLPAS